MLERFLIPLDSAHLAEGVLPLASYLAKQLAQPAFLVAVVADGEELNPLASLYEAELADLAEKRRRYAADYLNAVRARLEADGVYATPEVAVGDIAEEILATAARRDCGLILMATHGRVGPARWFVGSVADRVMHTSPVPVFLVRPHEGDGPEQTSIGHIIVPLDGSATAAAALPIAEYLARALGVPVTLVRTVDITRMSADAHGLAPQLMEMLEDEAKQYLTREADSLRAAGLTVQTQFSFLSPSLEIETTAAATPNPLVVMTTRGRSGVARTLLGSVADRVVRSSAAPVLLVPHE